MRRRALTGLLLGAALALSGCATASGETTAGVSAGEPAGAADLAFSGETLDGSSYDGRDLAGKPAVLWFWAPWCPTCRAQAGTVETVAERYAGRVNVVGVGGLADAADIREFAATVQGPTHLVDAEGAVWRHFGVTAQSTFLILDADGAVRSQGYLDNDALTARVAELVG